MVAKPNCNKDALTPVSSTGQALTLSQRESELIERLWQNGVPLPPPSLHVDLAALGAGLAAVDGEHSWSGWHLLEGEAWDGHAFPGVLDGYGAEAAIAIQVQQRIFVQVTRLIHIVPGIARCTECPRLSKYLIFMA